MPKIIQMSVRPDGEILVLDEAGNIYRRYMKSSQEFSWISLELPAALKPSGFLEKMGAALSEEFLEEILVNLKTNRQFSWNYADAHNVAVSMRDSMTILIDKIEMYLKEKG
jgi:hypothetical protein